MSVAENGADAVLIAQHACFALILMDCQMPEVDGLEATEMIGTGTGPNRHTPIVALTASALPEERERCLAVGMNDYLTKPVRLETLVSMLATWAPSPLPVVSER